MAPPPDAAGGRQLTSASKGMIFTPYGGIERSNKSTWLPASSRLSSYGKPAWMVVQVWPRPVEAGARTMSRSS
ncbi:MAG: hypothetical protein N839_0010430 [Desulfofustis sp. PB-SRB1]|nr:hypothetical protein [Desulfofustis sp. PB-SRB1]MBM1002816.1 hypothetical protein [Desulfofustis sp. PB-SRB1]